MQPSVAEFFSKLENALERIPSRLRVLQLVTYHGILESDRFLYGPFMPADQMNDLSNIDMKIDQEYSTGTVSIMRSVA